MLISVELARLHNDLIFTRPVATDILRLELRMPPSDLPLDGDLQPEMSPDEFSLLFVDEAQIPSLLEADAAAVDCEVVRVASLGVRVGLHGDTLVDLTDLPACVRQVLEKSDACICVPGTEVCIRYASSYWEIRVEISGSPTSS